MKIDQPTNQPFLLRFDVLCNHIGFVATASVIDVAGNMLMLMSLFFFVHVVAFVSNPSNSSFGLGNLVTIIHSMCCMDNDNSNTNNTDISSSNNNKKKNKNLPQQCNRLVHINTTTEIVCSYANTPVALCRWN